MPEVLGNSEELTPAVGSESDDLLGATLAFYATQHPAPGHTYSGISTPAGIVYLRVIKVDGLCEATVLEQDHEILLNTVESEDL